MTGQEMVPDSIAPLHKMLPHPQAQASANAVSCLLPEGSSEAKGASLATEQASQVCASGFFLPESSQPDADPTSHSVALGKKKS